MGGAIATEDAAMGAPPALAIDSGPGPDPTALPDPGAGLDASGRPTARLPLAQLLQVSVYWFGIEAVWGGYGLFEQERVKELLGTTDVGLGIALLAIVGLIVPVTLQPTIGSISDYTTSRWGRRKPYIAIGATLDVVFILGLALSPSYVSLIAFVLLLQFSSNFAQGPFQGYVPDLVPEEQVGLASGLMGLMSTLGLMGGYALVAIIGLGIMSHAWIVPLGIIALVELVTAWGTVFWVREGRAAKPREGRTWRQIALEAWGTDVLQNRSYVWLLASRFFILTAGGALFNFGDIYAMSALGLGDKERGFWLVVITGLVAVSTALGTVPSARLSDRFGRKTLIYAGCTIGAVGMSIVVVAPSILVVAIGALLIGFGAGNFLAVDWALMTDIVPKAASGRYMGLSNVATATAGPADKVLVGVTYWAVGNLIDLGTGIRFAYFLVILVYIVGALCLRPVVETRHVREPRLAPAPS